MLMNWSNEKGKIFEILVSIWKVLYYTVLNTLQNFLRLKVFLEKS